VGEGQRGLPRAPRGLRKWGASKWPPIPPNPPTFGAPRQSRDAPLIKCLVDESLEQLPVIRALRPGGLGHQHRGDLLLRIHPEVRPGVPRPHELAGRTRYAGEARLAADGKAEAEGVAR